jgi:hypothetical protein
MANRNYLPHTVSQWQRLTSGPIGLGHPANHGNFASRKTSYPDDQE